MIRNLKRSDLLIVLGLAALVGLWIGSYAGQLDPPVSSGTPTMKTLDEVEPRTPIHVLDLPLTISTPGSYFLAEDISTVGGGITITSSNVTIDLMGFTLTGGTGHGISASGVNEIIVKNGTVTDWDDDGLDLAGTGGSVVENVAATDNGRYGISTGSDSLVVSSSALRNTDVGIKVGGGSVVRESIASHSEYADGIEADWGARILNCVATFNAGVGINVRDRCSVTGCFVGSNTDEGILVRESNSMVAWNLAQGNGNTGTHTGGIRVNGTDNRIEGNHALDNGYGIYINNDSNLIIKNTVSGSYTANFYIAAGNFDAPQITTKSALGTATNSMVNISF